MATPDYYRREAQRCRDLASGSPDTEMANRWRSIAADYDNLAEAMEKNAPPTLQRDGVQRQPMQQQQKKAEDGK